MNEKTTSSERVETGRSFWSVFAKAVGLIMGVAIAYIVLYMAYKDGNTFYQSASAEKPGTDFVSPSSLPANGSVTVPDNANGSALPLPDSEVPSVDITKMPQTKEEIVEYYKAANAKVKSQAKSITRTYNRASNYNGVIETGSNPLLSRIGKAVMGKFLTEDLEPKTFVSRDEIAANFPPANTVCALSADDVENATCTDKGDFYEMEIHMLPEVDPVNGKGTGAVSTIITKQEITDAVAGYVEISDIHCDYENVYLIAIIDKATGDITKLYVHMPLYLNLSALGMDCKVGLCFEDRYTVEW